MKLYYVVNLRIFLFFYFN